MIASNSRLDIARAAAQEAGSMLINYSSDLAIKRKTPKDIVTAADLAAQEIIVEKIAKAFRDDAIVAEEGAWEQPDGAYWIIDPLDGTVNYSRGMPLYGVAIAHVDEDGEIDIGVINLPAFDELYWSQRGGGAWCGEKRISVSATSEVSDALVNISDFNTGPEKDHAVYNRLKLEAISHIHSRSMRTKNLSSAAVETAWVAAGRLDAYFMGFCHFWDSAAGSLLIREAGGRVSDLEGRRFGADSKLVLTSNAVLHDELVSIIGPHMR